MAPKEGKIRQGSISMKETARNTSGLWSRVGLALFGSLWVPIGGAFLVFAAQRFPDHWLTATLSLICGLLFLLAGLSLIGRAVTGRIPEWWRELLVHLAMLQD
jgi:hypothetical protein